MEKAERTSGNAISEKLQCPVCGSENNPDTIHCHTCSWYLDMRPGGDYDLELSRARQQYQMISTFSQVMQNMQVQSKMLEKISFRLDGLESEMDKIKVVDIEEIEPSEIYHYPPLDPIKAYDHFDDHEKRALWWNSLEAQWKKAFKLAVLNKMDTHEPSDNELQHILESKVLRFVGPRGMHPSIDFELTNLSGLRHLTNLEILVISHHVLESLEGIEHLRNLTQLFANSNKLVHLREIHYLNNLTHLYVNVNQIDSLHPLTKLVNLQTLYCNYNRLRSLNGITSSHSESMVEFYCLPNDNLPKEEVSRIERMKIRCLKG